MNVTSRFPALSDKELLDYTGKGFAVVKKVFSRREIAALEAEVERLLQPCNRALVQYRKFPWNESLPERIDPVAAHSDLFEQINRDERITSRVKRFLGDQRICHLKDKLIFKAPGQAGYGAHQDQSWWSKWGQSSITCLLAIDPADGANGGLQFLAGTHRSLLTDPQEPRYLQDADLQPYAHHDWCLPVLDAGDLVFFHGQTVHRSDANKSGVWRRGYYVSYCLEP